jgi:hypothetical protein
MPKQPLQVHIISLDIPRNMPSPMSTRHIPHVQILRDLAQNGNDCIQITKVSTFLKLETCSAEMTDDHLALNPRLLDLLERPSAHHVFG